MEEEDEGGDGGNEESDKYSEAIKYAKQRKRNDKTKDLVEKRVQTYGLINGRWKVLPSDYKFPNIMTIYHWSILR